MITHLSPCYQLDNLFKLDRICPTLPTLINGFLYEQEKTIPYIRGVFQLMAMYLTFNDL